MKARLQLLAEASAAFANAALEPDRLAEVIAHQLVGAVADSCGVLLLDERGAELRYAAFVHRAPEAQELMGRMFREVPLIVGEGIMGSVAKSQKSLLVPTLDLRQVLDVTRPEYRAVVEKHPAHTLMVVPLKAHGRLFGVLGMSRGVTPGAFTEEDLSLAEDLAGRASLSIAVGRLLEAERAATRRAMALADASKAIQTLDSRQALSTLVRLGAELLGDACVATLVEDGILRTKVAAHRNPAAEQAMQGIVEQALVEGSSPALRVMRENRAVRVEDARGYQPALSSSAAYTSQMGIDSLLICPIRIDDRPIGTIGVSRDRGGRGYTSADELFLQDLADRTALVIHNARLYEALQAAQREADVAAAQKDEFLTVASHELRTPVTTLQLMLQTALKQTRQSTGLPEWLRPRLERASRQSVRLVTLIDGLLEVSRIGAGKLMFHPEQLDLTGLVLTVIERFRDHEHHSTIAVNSVGPVTGKWDRERLDQVITNLLANALKYGQAKPVAVHVSATPDRAVLAVTDHGIGIAPENHARIFERFERAESSRNYGGFGVGLWIVRDLVRGMGGTVRVESELGQGATFTVELPR